MRDVFPNVPMFTGNGGVYTNGHAKSLWRLWQARTAEVAALRALADQRGRILSMLPGSPSVVDLDEAARFQMTRADKAEAEAAALRAERDALRGLLREAAPYVPQTIATHILRSGLAAALRPAGGAVGVPASLDTLLQKWADARHSYLSQDDSDEVFDRHAHAWNALLLGLRDYAASAFLAERDRRRKEAP